VSSVAQEVFPNRPVQLIMPFGPGGSDAMFRAFAASMSNVVKQQFVVIMVSRSGVEERCLTPYPPRNWECGYLLFPMRSLSRP